MTEPHDIECLLAISELPAASLVWLGNEPARHPTRYSPLFSPDRSDGIYPVYPLEELIGAIAGGSAVRAGIAAALRNFGPLFRPKRAEETTRPPVELNPAKQDKHIVGTNNYREGRSVLPVNPRQLLARFAGRSRQVGQIPLGQAGHKENFDAGDEIIGIYKNSKTGDIAETTRGTIHYGSDGSAHIVPTRPTGWTGQ
jgi:hypothetical protein